MLHDRSLAEDAVQETLIRTWRSLRQLRDPEHFESWQRRVLVHACIDIARASRWRGAERELPADLADPGDLEVLTANRDAVVRAYQTLSGAHRAAFVLRHYDGLTVPEIAETLGVPLGTAKSRLHYAEQAMARAMDADTRWAPEGGTA
jgi:RNA polymerase sigma-70 factor (ECF subfamily)